ncbi:Glycosyl transferase family 10 [Rhabdaerophilaceae bacterium]
MPSIAFFSTHRSFPWARQLEARLPAVEPAFREDWHITVQREEEDCRLLVVYDEPAPSFSTMVPRENRLVVLSEPPGISTYRPRYLDQFGHVLGPIEPVGSTAHWIRGQPALPWFFGIGFSKSGLVTNLSFDALAHLAPPEKRPELSVVLSGKSKLPKHKARLAFVDALKARLGTRLHIFGRSFQEISDKAEAILPFAYHLVLENNDISHFWTEKTADAYLGWALPVFSGCVNIGDYFPEGSFVALDIAKQTAAIDRIERLLDENLYQRHLPMIGEARARLLGPHNLAIRVRELAEGIPESQKLLAPTALYPNSHFSLYHRLRKALRPAKA